MQVLLVDDEEDLRFLTARMLRKAGATQVEAVASGQEAIDRLRSGAIPDLVILDQNMPGMDGVQTLALIRAMLPDLPVLISTGQPDVQEWDCFHQKNVAILAKPFTMDEMKEKLAEMGMRTRF